jgi:hypothetical protein
MLGMLGHARTNKNAVEMRGIARNSGWRGRGIGTAMGIALAVSLFAASGAHAQNCTTNASFNFQNLALSPPGITSGVASAITAANTAFLLQNEAFIGAPPNPAPGQQGGGVWVRGVREPKPKPEESGHSKHRVVADSDVIGRGGF